MTSVNPSICFFIINLDGANERLEYVISQVKRYNLPFKRISAINGKDLYPPYKDYNERKFNIFFGKKTNPNVIACFQSHLKVLNKFLGSDYELAIILEDDACIRDNFDIYINDIIKTSQHWDILRLSGHRNSVFFNRKLLDSGNTLATNLTLLKGTCGYVVNRNAAKELSNELKPFYLPIDIAIENEWKFSLRSKCLLPLPIKDAIVHKQSDLLKSQIPRGEKITRYRLTAKLHNITQKIYRIGYRILTSRLHDKSI